MVNTFTNTAHVSPPGGDMLECRVLIIEDHQGNRTLIRERLEAEGLLKAVRTLGEVLAG